MSPLRKKMIEELQLHNLADSTIDSYIKVVERFSKHFGKTPQRLGPDDVRQYLLHLIRDKQSAPNTIHVNRAALRFLYVRTLKRGWFDEEIARYKRPPILPAVLSREEVTRILDHTTNLKHWTMIATFYATAVRSNELRLLKVDDIDSQRMVIHVRKGKGSVPRVVGLSPGLLERLRVYYRGRKPKEWLFPSREHPDRPLENKSIRWACRAAARRAGIRKPVSPHVFRHSAATHMLEAGADLRTIQELLGHTDIRTTARYLRISNTRIQAAGSPFDSLSLSPIDHSHGDGRQR
jgi:integrase/recombinase XerD